MSAPASARRPLGVTVLVILLWVEALAALAFGLFLVLEHGDADLLRHVDRSEDTVLAIGIALLVAGALSAVFATMLGRGSALGRAVVGFLAAFHLGTAVWSLVVLDGVTRGSAVTEAVISVAILWALFYERGSNEYFSR